MADFEHWESQKLISRKIWVIEKSGNFHFVVQWPKCKQLFFFDVTGGEKRFDTNINFFLEEYGIMINNDSVVRTNYHKYFHPKECLISNGVLNRAISEAAGKSKGKQ